MTKAVTICFPVEAHSMAHVSPDIPLPVCDLDCIINLENDVHGQDGVEDISCCQ